MQCSDSKQHTGETEARPLAACKHGPSRGSPGRRSVHWWWWCCGRAVAFQPLGALDRHDQDAYCCCLSWVASAPAPVYTKRRTKGSRARKRRAGSNNEPNAWCQPPHMNATGETRPTRRHSATRRCSTRRGAAPIHPSHRSSHTRPHSRALTTPPLRAPPPYLCHHPHPHQPLGPEAVPPVKRHQPRAEHPRRDARTDKHRRVAAEAGQPLRPVVRVVRGGHGKRGQRRLVVLLEGGRWRRMHHNGRPPARSRHRGGGGAGGGGPVGTRGGAVCGHGGAAARRRGGAAAAQTKQRRVARNDVAVCKEKVEVARGWGSVRETFAACKAAGRREGWTSRLFQQLSRIQPSKEKPRVKFVE